MRRALLLPVLAGLVALAPANPAAAAPLVLVDQGRAETVVVVPDTAAPSVREAALDLAEVLRTMSGARVPIAADSEGPALVLGVRPEDRSLPPLGYHVLREGRCVYLSGGSD